MENEKSNSREICAFFLAYALGLTVDQAFITFLSAGVLNGDSLLTASALVTFCSVPRALLLIPAGILADRIGNQRSMALASAIRLAPLMALVLLWDDRGINTAPLALSSAVFGCGEAIFLVGSQSWVAESRPSGNLSQMQSVFVVCQRLCSIAAPILFGAAVSYGPTRLIELLALISLVSFLFTFWAKSEKAPSTAPRAGLKVQLRQASIAFHSLLAIKETKLILAFILVAESITTALFSVGYAGICEQQGWNEQILSMLLIAYGLGAAGGAVTGERASERFGIIRCTIGASISLVLFCFVKSFPLALVISVLSGLFIGATSIQLMLLFLEKNSGLPNKGILISALSLASFGSAAISPTIFGAIANLSSVSIAFALFAAALSLMAVIFRSLNV